MSEWQENTEVGGFKVLGLLGRGGMGVVYRAQDPTGRLVALKTLEQASDATLAERFLREGQAQAALDHHPNIVRVFGAGELDGRFYLVQELVEGGDLQERILAGPLELSEVVRIVDEVADAVAFAHANGILHRDLKPSNVILGKDGAKLLDFGVAHLEGRRTLTATGEIVGTIAYMAPEQLNNSKEADARADVYGLGGILFTTLTGRAPFEAGSQIALMQKVFNEPVPRLRTLRPDAPKLLEQVCSRALAKNPDQRFESVADFRRALSGDSVPSPPSLLSRLWARRSTEIPAELPKKVGVGPVRRTLGGLGAIAFVGLFALVTLLGGHPNLLHWFAEEAFPWLLGLYILRLVAHLKWPRQRSPVLPYLVGGGLLVWSWQYDGHCKCGWYAHSSPEAQEAVIMVLHIAAAWSLLLLSAKRLLWPPKVPPTEEIQLASGESPELTSQRPIQG